MTSKVKAIAPNGKTTPTTEKKQVVKKLTKVEELENRVKELTAQLQKVPKNLDDRIAFFNKKKELIRKLRKLQNSKAELKEHINSIDEILETADFDKNESYNIVIEGGAGYNKNQIFVLQNPLFISDVLQFLVEKMDKREEFLKHEISID